MNSEKGGPLCATTASLMSGSTTFQYVKSPAVQICGMKQ